MARCSTELPSTGYSIPSNKPTIEFTASPDRVARGGSSTLTWKATDATGCTSPEFSTDNAANGVYVYKAPSPTGTPGDGNKGFHITCTGDGGSSSEFIIVADYESNGTVNGPVAGSTSSITVFVVGLAEAGAQWPIMTNTKFYLQTVTAGMKSCSVGASSTDGMVGSLAVADPSSSIQYLQYSKAGTYDFKLTCIGKEATPITSTATASVTVVAPVAQACPVSTAGTFPNCVTKASISIDATNTTPIKQLNMNYPKTTDTSSYYLLDFGDGTTFGGTSQTLDASSCSPIDDYGTCAGSLNHAYSAAKETRTASMKTVATYVPKLHYVSRSNCPGCSVQQAMERTPVIATGAEVTITDAPKVYLTTTTKTAFPLLTTDLSLSGIDSVDTTFYSWAPVGGA
jgi:hypothetical protein